MPGPGADVDQCPSHALNMSPVTAPSRFAADKSPLLAHRRGPAGDEREDLPPDGALSCIAAFYPCESAVRDVARCLLRHHGLKASQLVLMEPRDADPARFARHALRWTGRWPGGHGDGAALPQLLVIAAGLSMLALAIGWWVLESETPLVAMLVGLVVLMLAAALLSDRLRWPWTDPPRVRRFETSVRHQLSLGDWALVVHHIPRDHQTGVMALLRGDSLRWCAVARPSTRL